MLALVSACVALAWLDGSPVAVQAGGVLEGERWIGRAFLACLAAAFAAYLLGVATLTRAAPSLRAVGALAVLVQAAPLFAPLLLSSDAWTYWAYGAMPAAGADPYADTIAGAGAAGAAYAGEAWVGTTSVYGPAFTLASEPLAALAGSDPDVAAWTYKTLGAAAVLACAWLAARLASRPALALAFVGWNPLLAVHFGGGGHNDAWMAALVLAALVLAGGGRPRGAGAAWALAILVKWVPLVFLALRALEARATRRRVDHLGFAAAALVVAALAVWRYGLDWLSAFGPLARNAAEQTSYALPSRLEQLGLPEWAAVGLAATGLVVGLGWLARHAVRGGRARLGLAAGFVLLATPWLTAWYTIWAVPLAAAEEDRPARLLALALCAYLLPQTIPV